MLSTVRVCTGLSPCRFDPSPPQQNHIPEYGASEMASCLPWQFGRKFLLMLVIGFAGYVPLVALVLIFGIEMGM